MEGLPTERNLSAGGTASSFSYDFIRARMYPQGRFAPDASS